MNAIEMKSKSRDDEAENLHQDQIISGERERGNHTGPDNRELHEPAGQQGNENRNRTDDQFISQELAHVIFEETKRPDDQTIDRARINFLDHFDFVHPSRGDARDKSGPNRVSEIRFQRKAVNFCRSRSAKKRKPQSQLDESRDQRLQNRVGKKIKAILQIGDDRETEKGQIPSPKTLE